MKQIIIALVSVLLVAGLALADRQEQEDTVWNLQEIVITATRTPHLLNDVPVETVVITKAEIEKMNARNVVDVLKNVAGVNVSVHDDVFGTYTWRANMRGLSFNNGYGLILIDGQRVMGSGQSGGMGEYGIGLNQISLDMVEKIEVVKGPSSALYGSDAITGVINIFTKKTPEKATANTGATYGWYKIKEKVRDGAVAKPSDDGQSRNISQTYVSFGDKVSDRFGYFVHYNYESAEDTGRSPIKSDRHFFMGKINADVSRKMDFFLKTELSKYEKTDNREEDSYRVSVGVDFYPSDKRLFSLKGYKYVWDFTHGYPGYSYGYKHGDIGYTQAEVQYTWYTTDWNTITAGGEIQKQSMDYAIENPDGSIVNVEKDVDTISLYMQDEIGLSESLTLIGGARYDHHSYFGSEVNPKISLMYRFSGDTIFRASAGRAFKSPTIRELYYDAPYKHGGFYYMSNPDLKPEKAIGYSASIERWLFNRRALLNIGYFRNDVKDMVTREDTGDTYNGLPLKEYKNVDNASYIPHNKRCKFWNY